jgi:predicted dehydrogenase
MERRRIGLGVIGSGRIGTLRSRLAADHPAVDFLAVSDLDEGRAASLAQRVGAGFSSGDNLAVIDHADVNAVIVSTSEGEHRDAVLAALERGHHVLVEKPIALTLDDADDMIAAAARSRGTLHVGYSRRFRRRYHVAKEQIVQGRMGTLLGANTRLYNSRSQAMAMLDRDPHATPVVDGLTYYVDLMHWFFEGRRLVEVRAVGQRGVLAAAGYDVDDLTWATLVFDDGAAVSVGACYSLPSAYPALGHAARVELIGTDGVMLLDDDHTDQVMHSEHGIPHVYLPDHTVNTVFLSSGTPGDWALGELIGPLPAETRAWLDHVATGKSCNLTDPQTARANLEATLAIEIAARTGETVRLPLEN